MATDDFDSAGYWEARYQRGGNSGAGSQDALAAYKAGFLNCLIASHRINSVMELGSGDGKQLALAHYPSYIGVDVSSTAVSWCRKRYLGDSTKSFLTAEEAYRASAVAPTAELSMSLDVIFHLVEDDVYETYMARLFDAATKYVVIYSSDSESVASGPAVHVRHRRFSEWVTKHRSQWHLIMREPNPFPFDPRRPASTSFADFYVYKKFWLPLLRQRRIRSAGE